MSTFEIFFGVDAVLYECNLAKCNIVIRKEVLKIFPNCCKLSTLLNAKNKNIFLRFDNLTVCLNMSLIEFVKTYFENTNGSCLHFLSYYTRVSFTNICLCD